MGNAAPKGSSVIYIDTPLAHASSATFTTVFNCMSKQIIIGSFVPDTSGTRGAQTAHQKLIAAAVLQGWTVPRECCLGGSIKADGTMAWRSLSLNQVNLGVAFGVAPGGARDLLDTAAGKAHAEEASRIYHEWFEGLSDESKERAKQATAGDVEALLLAQAAAAAGAAAAAAAPPTPPSQLLEFDYDPADVTNTPGMMPPPDGREWRFVNVDVVRAKVVWTHEGVDDRLTRALSTARAGDAAKPHAWERLRGSQWIALHTDAAVLATVEDAYTNGLVALPYALRYKKPTPDQHQYVLDFDTMLQIDVFFPADPARTCKIRRRVIAPAAPRQVPSQASAGPTSASYLKPMRLHTRHAAKFDAAGYEVEEDLRKYVVGEGKSVDDLAAEFVLPKPHAIKLHEFLVGNGAAISGGGRGGAYSASTTSAAAPSPSPAQTGQLPSLSLSLSLYLSLSANNNSRLSIPMIHSHHARSKAGAASGNRICRHERVRRRLDGGEDARGIDGVVYDRHSNQSSGERRVQGTRRKRRDGPQYRIILR